MSNIIEKLSINRDTTKDLLTHLESKSNQNKSRRNEIDGYYNSIKQSKSSNMFGGGGSEAQIALAYYLANTNRYDELIAKIARQAGLNESRIILLILVNNVDDIKVFCRQNNLSNTQTQKIISLKRHSALYNLHHNF